MPIALMVYVRSATFCLKLCDKNIKIVLFKTPVPLSLTKIFSESEQTESWANYGESMWKKSVIAMWRCTTMIGEIFTDHEKLLSSIYVSPSGTQFLTEKIFGK